MSYEILVCSFLLENLKEEKFFLAFFQPFSSIWESNSLHKLYQSGRTFPEHFEETFQEKS